VSNTVGTVRKGDSGGGGRGTVGTTSLSGVLILEMIVEPKFDAEVSLVGAFVDGLFANALARDAEGVESCDKRNWVPSEAGDGVWRT